jgi:hypothetical protein
VRWLPNATSNQYLPVGLGYRGATSSVRLSVSHEYISVGKNMPCLLPKTINLKTIYADKDAGTAGYDILEYFGWFKGSEKVTVASIQPVFRRLR